MPETATRQSVVDEGQNQQQMIDELAAFLGVQDEPPEKKQPTEAAQDDEPTPDEDGESVEETEAEDTEASDRDQDAGEEAEEAAEERWMPKSLDDLAEALESDPEELSKTLKVRTKIEGEEGEATLSDLLKSYQLEGALNKRLESQSKERKEFEAFRMQQQQALQTKMQEADDMVSAVEQMLLSDYQSIDWTELKENDPTEYLMQQQRLQETYGAMQRAKAQMQAKREESAKQQQEEFQHKWGAFLREQRDALYDKLPNWRDEGKRTAELGKVRGYLNTIGASDQEIDQMVDHRLWVMAVKAMKYDEMQTKANPKAKQLKTKPKFVPPGIRQNREQTSAKRKQALFEKAKQTQSTEDWTDALQERLTL